MKTVRDSLIIPSFNMIDSGDRMVETGAMKDSTISGSLWRTTGSMDISNINVTSDTSIFFTETSPNTTEPLTDLTGNIDDLEKLLEEIEDWDKNIDLSEHNNFTVKERAKSIDLAFDMHGELDLENLQTEINTCKEEYIKVRVPNDVDIIVVNKIDENNNNNIEIRVKTIAEYFV